MVLEEVQIKEAIKARINGAEIDSAAATCKRYMAHVFGINNSQLIEQISSYENDGQKKLRDKYARSNKDMFTRLLRPIDKVFSAKGGSRYYDASSEQQGKIKDMLNNVEWGYTPKKWAEDYWLPAYLVDPNGLIFIERTDVEAYPTYKSTESIYSYKLSGRSIDWVIFKVHDKSNKVVPNKYRVVDDSNDYMVKLENDTLTIISEETFANPFGKVPALIVSDIPNFTSDFFKSPIDCVIELANEYLRDGSVKTIYKFLHGFPKSWRYMSMCPECKGTGELEGKTCPRCNGIGWNVKADVSDVINIPLPRTKDEPTVAPNLAGYITPDIQAWDKMTDELKWLEVLMNDTLWGTHVDDEKSETATGRFIDVQPVNDRLNKFSDAAELVEKFITDMVAGFTFKESYKGCSINYGRRFLIESADVVWEKYENARTKGAPQATLDYLLTQYYQTELQNDSVEMERQLKKVSIEPFVHLTVAEVNGLSLPKEEFYKKLYANEYLKSLTEAGVLTKKVEELKKGLSDYVKELIKNEEPQEPQNPDDPNNPSNQNAKKDTGF